MQFRGLVRLPLRRRRRGLSGARASSAWMGSVLGWQLTNLRQSALRTAAIGLGQLA